MMMDRKLTTTIGYLVKRTN